MTSQLIFKSCTLETISHNNQIWFTASALAKALGYSDSRSVTKIYSRNEDEFTSCMTTVIKSVTVRKTGNVKMNIRIFSLAVHLIEMFCSAGNLLSR